MVLTLLFLGSTVIWGQSPPPSYEFLLNGTGIKPRIFSLRGNPAVPSEGDVVHVVSREPEESSSEFYFVLGAPGRYDLRTDPSEPGILREVTKEGNARPLAVCVGHRYADNGTQIVVNPFETFPPGEIRHLKGITLDGWSPTLAKTLAGIEPANTCVALLDAGAPSTGGPMPPLPSELAYLVIDQGGNQGIQDLSGLKALTSLRFLIVSDPWIPDGFDVAKISKASNLSYLDLTMATLVHPKSLAGLTGLRHLDLAWCKGLTGLEFVKEMTRLAWLDVSYTEIGDLSPLSSCSELFEIRANSAMVSKLPTQPMPSLHTLSAIPHRVPSKDLDAFRSRNPQCGLRTGYNQTLQLALKDADRLQITPVDFPEAGESPEILLDLRNKEEVQFLAKSIAIDEANSGFHCMCDGTLQFEFFSGNKPLTEITFHHGRSFRWYAGWPWDGALSPASAETILRWLDKKGIHGPSEEVEESNQQEKEYEDLWIRATTGVPEAVKAALLKSDTEAFEKALSKSIPDPTKRTVALLKMHGAPLGSWFGLIGFEIVISGSLDKIPKEVLGPVLESSLLQSGDRQLRRGCARYYGRARSALKGWVPQEPSRVNLVVLGIQRESRSADVRESGVKNLVQWASLLPEAEVLKFLEAGLHDPSQAVRAVAFRAAGLLGRSEVAPFLLDVLRGQAITIWELPAVPPDEQVVVKGLSGLERELVSDRDGAALALGFLRYQQARKELAEMKSSPRIEVALALLGETGRLRPEYFQGDWISDEDLRAAALEAALRSRERSLIRMALYSYCDSMPYWEREAVPKKFSKCLIEMGAPDSKTLGGVSKLEDLKKWADGPGQQFLHPSKP
jgi:hypothetical protein